MADMCRLLIGLQVEDMSRLLIECGFNYAGKDSLTSGITGEVQEAYTYFGPIYYQVCTHTALFEPINLLALRRNSVCNPSFSLPHSDDDSAEHMVVDKMHARSR